ncbi:PREDICTED: uncharacterized protein LOC108782758 [Cyphomyrmex costatus]|uniref:uncharacterized protein LOC108782758 n=1 Tax=Cyphomyrmex costatus TaxID=456900 RepID=UPI0008522B86|nr:PREDICTED: uncharacterized protein LOC108782758 [Cyphomyrmex costatus]
MSTMSSERWGAFLRNEDKNQMNRWHAPRLVAVPVLVTYPENRLGFRETVPRGSLAPRVSPPGVTPLLLLTTAIFCLHRAHRAAHCRSIARSLARSHGLQRQVTALPPIELDGSSSGGEDEDQTPGRRDRDSPAGPRPGPRDTTPHHTTPHHTTPHTCDSIDPTQCHRRRAVSRRGEAGRGGHVARRTAR